LALAQTAFGAPRIAPVFHQAHRAAPRCAVAPLHAWMCGIVCCGWGSYGRLKTALKGVWFGGRVLLHVQVGCFHDWSYPPSPSMPPGVHHLHPVPKTKRDRHRICPPVSLPGPPVSAPYLVGTCVGLGMWAWCRAGSSPHSGRLRCHCICSRGASKTRSAVVSPDGPMTTPLLPVHVEETGPATEAGVYAPKRSSCGFECCFRRPACILSRPGPGIQTTRQHAVDADGSLPIDIRVGWRAPGGHCFFSGIIRASEGSPCRGTPSALVDAVPRHGGFVGAVLSPVPAEVARVPGHPGQRGCLREAAV
jgi:hypothetical protein